MKAQQSREHINGVLKEFSGELPVMVTLGSEEEASALSADKNVLAQTNRLRIAQVKDRAIELGYSPNFLPSRFISAQMARLARAGRPKVNAAS